MAGETTFAKIKYAEAADEVNKFPVNVSEPGAKTIDKFLEEKTLHIKKYAGGATLASGELAVQEKTAETFTLPLAATENQLIGIFSTVAETKIATSGGAEIFGDFLQAATCKLSTNQHLILQSAGGKWLIVAGEPQRETAYAVAKAVASGKEELASSTRETEVVFYNETTGSVTITVGATAIGKYEGLGALSFRVAAGVKWKWEGTAGNGKASYRTL